LKDLLAAVSGILVMTVDLRSQLARSLLKGDRSMGQRDAIHPTSPRQEVDAAAAAASDQPSFQSIE
jgi:hypothetical protein